MRIARFLLTDLLLLASATAATAASAAAGSWGPGVEAKLPADAAAQPGVVLSGVSCAAPGTCAAVGTYYDSSQRNSGLLLSESAGKWTTGVKATPPAGAVPGHQVFLSRVSCASVGYCAAIGSYDTGRTQEGLLLTRSAGEWSPGVLATMPGGFSSPSVILSSVSCSSAGNCVAVGRYNDEASAQQALLVTEKAGTWSAGVQAPLPADAVSPHTAELTSVSCPSDGNCTAVGEYVDSAYHFQGLLLSESSGTWTAAKAAMPAAVSPTGRVDLTSVSCASAGNCSAVGNFDGADNQNHGVLLTETTGTWGPGVEAMPPASNGEPRIAISDVSCGSPGNCTATGAHLHFPYGFLLEQSSGTWTTGLSPTPPGSGAQGTVELNSVFCASAGNCTAVGTYTQTPDNSGQALMLSEVSGKWTRGVKATLPAGATSAVLYSVSCASAGNCTAVGASSDSMGSPRGLLITQSVPKPSRAVKVHGSLRRSPNIRNGSLTTQARRLDARRLRTTFQVSVRVTHATTLRIDYSPCRATAHGPSCTLEAASRSSRPFKVRPGLRHLTWHATVAYPRSGQRTSCVTAEVKDLNPRGSRQYLLGPSGARHTQACPH
jgi:hypothetical protein